MADTPPPRNLGRESDPWARWIESRVGEAVSSSGEALARTFALSQGQTSIVDEVARQSDAVKQVQDESRVVQESIVPVEPPPPPTDPTAISSLGVANVHWDGLLVNDDGLTIPPTASLYAVVAYVSAVEPTPEPDDQDDPVDDDDIPEVVEEWDDPTPWERVGQPLVGEGDVVFPGIVGDTYWFRLVSVDFNGVEGAASDFVEVTIDGIDYSSLEQEVQDQLDAAEADAAAALVAAASASDAASAAQTTADGKNTVYRQPGEPGGTDHAVGDTWFDSNAGYALYTWNGSAWEAGAFGTNAIEGSAITSAKIANAAITNAKILNGAVTNAKISNLDAGKITTGFLDADRIDVGTITTEKLVVGAVADQYVANGGFEQGLDCWELVQTSSGSSASHVTTPVHSGDGALELVRGSVDAEEADIVVGQKSDFLIPITPGDSYYVTLAARASGTVATGFSVTAAWYGSDRTTLSTENEGSPVVLDGALDTDYQKFEGAITAPSDAAYMRIMLINGALSSTIYIDSIEAFKVAVSAMIADGSITTEKLVAESILAEHIAALQIEAQHISAGAIETNHITAGAIEVSHLSPSVGGDIDLTANTFTVQTNARLSQNEGDIANANTQLAELGYALVVDATEGVTISKPGSTTKLRLTNDEVQILEGGTPVTHWNSGQLYVDSLVGQQVYLGPNLLVESDGAGGAVFKVVSEA